MMLFAVVEYVLAGILLIVSAITWWRTRSKGRTLRALVVACLVFAVVGYGASELLQRQRPHAAIVFQWDGTDDFEFAWAGADELYLGRLRRQYALDEKVAQTHTDLDKVLALGAWVHSLWTHDGTNQPSQNDPITIIEEAQQGESFRCVEYAIVLAGSLNAVGLPARRLGLKTRDVETRPSGAGHVVVEAYLQDEGRWVFVDPQFGVIPTLEGVPLNAVEFQQALVDGDAVHLAGFSRARYIERFVVERIFYPRWILQYLYYFDVPLDNHVGVHSEHLMLVPQGAQQPQVFQRVLPLDGMNYTSDAGAFYKAPLQ